MVLKSPPKFSAQPTDPSEHVPKHGEFDEFGSMLHQRAQQRRGRFCVVLCGDVEWGKDAARAMCASYAPESVIQVTDGNLLAQHKTATIGISRARQLLGSEFATVVYDCFSGFDADAVGILGGTIKAGGLFIMVAPTIEQWAEFDDPQYARIMSYGDAKPKSSRYIKRLVKCITKSPHCLLVRQHHRLPHINEAQSTCASRPDFTDQNNAIAAVKRVIDGARRHPVVLLSDRGRGKSAALGIATAQLLNSSLKHIAVTSLNRAATASVFKHAALHTQFDGLRFVAPDKLIATKADLDLLLVDEAASIPLSMLQKLLEMYPRIAFASTVHGYEGTGRGFALRFKELLDAHTRGWKSCTLTAPIRWARDDALEQFLFDTLLLNAEPATLSMASGTNTITDEISSPAASAELHFSVIDRNDLSQNESLTRDLFGLLTQAHYRTRPSDLRHLLDAANLNIFTISRDASRDSSRDSIRRSEILAVAVVGIEGGFTDDIARKIWANQSRPNGHLLAQLLCAQQGLIDAARLQIARIMRIVVNPSLQRRGIGRQLLEHIADFYLDKADLLGSTFAVNLAVLEFWLDSDYLPVRIGQHQSHNTGSHSCTLIKAISAAGTSLLGRAADKFSDNLGHQLNTTLSAIDAALIPPIYRALEKTNTVTLKDSDLVDLVGFAFANQNMENIPASLSRLTEHVLKADVFGNDDPRTMLLVERILLGKSWSTCTALRPPRAKKQGITRLRTSVADSLMALYPDAPRNDYFNLPS